MHKLNVLIIGPSSFFTTLNELKSFLKFNPLPINSNNEYEIILFHVDNLKNKKEKDLIDKHNSIKICAAKTQDASNNYDAFLELPTTLNEINSVIENTFAKNQFNKNSSIKIKNYFLDKNEKKLINSSGYIILTEKEVQLLVLLLDNKKPISKDMILSSVWNYSSDADTHTVETHIYRLRKKISNKFMDYDFIINNKDGYSL